MGIRWCKSKVSCTNTNDLTTIYRPRLTVKDQIPTKRKVNLLYIRFIRSSWTVKMVKRRKLVVGSVIVTSAMQDKTVLGVKEELLSVNVLKLSTQKISSKHQSTNALKLIKKSIK